MRSPLVPLIIGIAFLTSAENREYILRRREFHVAPRAEAIAMWWTPTGPGTLLAAIGALLVLAAYLYRRRLAR